MASSSTSTQPLPTVDGDGTTPAQPPPIDAQVARIANIVANTPRGGAEADPTVIFSLLQDLLQVHYAGRTQAEQRTDVGSGNDATDDDDATAEDDDGVGVDAANADLQLQLLALKNAKVEVLKQQTDLQRQQLALAQAQGVINAQLARDQLAANAANTQVQQQFINMQAAAAESAATAATAKRAAQVQASMVQARKLSTPEKQLQSDVNKITDKTTSHQVVGLMRSLHDILGQVDVDGRAAKASEIAGHATTHTTRTARVVQMINDTNWAQVQVGQTVAGAQPWWLALILAINPHGAPLVTDINDEMPAVGDTLSGAWAGPFNDMLTLLALVGELTGVTAAQTAAAGLLGRLPPMYSDTRTDALVAALTQIAQEGNMGQAHTIVSRLTEVLKDLRFEYVKFKAPKATTGAKSKDTKPTGTASQGYISSARARAGDDDATASSVDGDAGSHSADIVRAKLSVRFGAKTKTKFTELDTVFDSGSSHVFISEEVFNSLGGMRESAASIDHPLLTSMLQASGMVHFAQAIEPWWLDVRGPNGQCGRVAAYPLPGLPEPMLVGVAGWRQLGGVRIHMPSTGPASVCWPTDLPASMRFACESGSAPTATATSSSSSTSTTSSPLQSVTMMLVAPDGTDMTVEMCGTNLIANAGTAQQRLLVTMDQIRKVRAVAGVMHSQRHAPPEERETAGKLAALAHVYLFRPDLRQTGFDSVMDPSPDPAPGAESGIDVAQAAYAFATGLDKFEAQARAVPGAPRKVIEYLIRRVREIKGLTLLASDVPPGPFGPVRGVGSVHRIRLLPNADVTTVYDRARPQSRDKQAALHKTKDVWLEFGVLEKVDHGKTRVVNVPVVVTKRDAQGQVVGYRVAVDFRKLNAICELDRYTPPSQTTVLDGLSLAWLATVVDMKALFNQFLLHLEERYLTTTQFAPGELYQFAGAPFGLSSIMATAQRFMDEHFRSATCVPYVDDCAIAHMDVGNWEAAVDEVVAFLTKCADVNMAVNLDKLQLLVRRPESLGHIVDLATHTYKPKHARLQVLGEYKQPTTNAQLRRFLSMAAAWARFVPGWAMVATRMRAIIFRSSPLKWTDDALAAFGEARRMLVEACSIKALDETKATYLFTDASKHGLGWVIAQLADGAAAAGTEGLMRIVACGGRATQSFERRLDIGELELLAFREALQRDALLLLGLRIPAVWCVDNRSVMHIRTQKQAVKSEAVRRWLVEMQFGDAALLEVRWVPSGANPADAISRMYEDDGDVADDSDGVLPTTRGGRVMDHVRARLAPEPTAHAAALMARAGDDDDDGVEPGPEPAVASHSDEASDGSAHTPLLVSDDDDEDAYMFADGAEEIADSAPMAATTTSALEGADDDVVVDEPPERAAPMPLPPITLQPAVEGALEPTTALQAASAPHVPAPDGSDAIADDEFSAAELDAALSTEALRQDVNSWRSRISIATHRDGSQLAWLLRAAAQQREVPPFVRRLEATRDVWGRLFVLSPHSLKRTMYVPPELVRDIVAEMHAVSTNGGAHRRAFGTLNAIQERFFSPLFAKAVAEHVAACHTCQQLARPTAAHKARLGFDSTADRKFGRVYMDVFAIEGQFFAIMLDWVSGTIEVEPLARNDGKHIADAIDFWCCRYGAMDRLVVDRAKANLGEHTQAMQTKWSFILDPITARNQQANSAERHIGTIKQALRAMMHLRTGKNNKSTVTRAHIAAARLSYMTAVSSSRGYSPFELLHNVPPRLPIDQQAGTPVHTETAGMAAFAPEVSPDVAARLTQMFKAEANAKKAGDAIAGMQRRHQVDAKHRAKRYGDAKKPLYVPKLGDVVWIENNQAQHATKFQNLIRRGHQAVVVEVDEVRQRVRTRDFLTAAPQSWMALRRITPVVSPSPTSAATTAPITAPASQSTQPSTATAASAAPQTPSWPIALATEWGVIRDIVHTEDHGLMATLDSTELGGGITVVAVGDTLPKAIVTEARRLKRAATRQTSGARRGNVTHVNH